MKAVGVNTYGGPEALEIVDLPEEQAGPGEVRLRVFAAAVNPTDTLARNGSRVETQKIDPPPYVPGMDAAGVVDQIGPEVTTGIGVGDAAMAMIEEVRRQFREIPGLLEGTAKPEVEKCVAISTDAAIKRMMLPGALAIVTPVAVGFAVSPEALGGLLAGVTVSGVAMAIFMSNAGGAWDNAKKSFEGGGYTSKVDGTVYAKGSDAHNAAVVGDTVGDPFKDTSGPSLNILLKLMSIVALVFAPVLADWTPLIPN